MTRKVTETEFFKYLVKSDNFNTIMYDEEMDRIIAEVTGGTNAVIYIYNDRNILVIPTISYMEEDDLKQVNNAVNEVLMLNNTHNRWFEEDGDVW